MSEVKRYDFKQRFVTCGDDRTYLPMEQVEVAQGDWISSKDYDNLASSLSRTKAELEEARRLLNEAVSTANDWTNRTGKKTSWQDKANNFLSNQQSEE